MPTRLPRSCDTLAYLPLSSLSSALSLSSLSSLLALSALLAFLALLVLLAFFEFLALLSALAALAVLPPLPLFAVVALLPTALSFAAAEAGSISAITFWRRIAITGQLSESSRLLGRMPRSASPLLIACAVSFDCCVGTICKEKLW